MRILTQPRPANTRSAVAHIFIHTPPKPAQSLMQPENPPSMHSIITPYPHTYPHVFQAAFVRV
ncbi:hypothetical protein [Kingella oralis]|uniref:hypothetical protein n=1 Tax=Kingella oralis TaxID=505 RepID=UPI002D7E97F4|nr:hypothetical protein [Kingella oralis]